MRSPSLHLTSPHKERRFIPRINHGGFRARISVIDLPETLQRDELIAGYEHAPELTFEHVPFYYPLWILYYSGTTGVPKAIVQGQVGILLEHLKTVGPDSNVKRGDRFFQYTITGWMMWNILVGSLLVGATAILYDGSPFFPDPDVLWKLAEVDFWGWSLLEMGRLRIPQDDLNLILGGNAVRLFNLIEIKIVYT